jgi:predicted transcriptional regulator
MVTENISDLPNSKPQLPTSVFIKSNVNYKNFCDTMKLTIGSKELFCKSLTNNLKLQMKTSDSFRRVIKLFKEKEIDFHTYQTKQENPYRIIFQNLHHTTSIDLIIQELSDNGVTARQIVNIKNKIIKLPFPLIFIGLELDHNNNEIFKFNSIL